VVEKHMPLWGKSSASGLSGCVEVAIIDRAVLMRDSKNPDETWLRFSLQEWVYFLRSEKVGSRGSR
jgi:hypothetical protein